jgi:hypothetical protein
VGQERTTRNAAEAKAEAIAVAQAHLTAIAFIEEHLFDPMTIKTIAQSKAKA